MLGQELVLDPVADRKLMNRLKEECDVICATNMIASAQIKEEDTAYFIIPFCKLQKCRTSGLISTQKKDFLPL